ncbi:MAG: hypothetical protein WBB94_02230 [Candidatus Saccharimonadaceae bacterium]
MANEAIKERILEVLQFAGQVTADDEAGLCDVMGIECTITAFKRALGSLRFKTRRVLLVRKYVPGQPPRPSCRRCTLSLIA